MTYTCRCHGSCGCTPIVTTQPTGASAPSGLDEVISIAGIPRKKRFGLAPNNNSAAIWSLLQWPTEDDESVQKRQLQELKDADIQHIRDKVRAQIMAVEQERQRHKQQTRTKNAKQLAIQKRVGIVPQHATLDDDESDDDDDIPFTYPANEEKEHKMEKENKGEETANDKKGGEKKEESSSNDIEQKYVDPIVTALSRQQRIKSHTAKAQPDEKFYAETNAKQDERRLKMAYFRQKFDEERKAQLARDHSIAPRDLPDSTISFEQNKPVFHPYGNANLHPVSGGVMYGNYMASHNTNALSPRKTAPIHTVFESVREKVEQKKKQTKRALRRHAELQRQQLLSSQQSERENRSRQQQQIARQQAYIQQLHNQLDHHKHQTPANTSTDDGYFVQLTPRVKPSTGIKRPASAGSNRAILTR